MRPPYTVAVCCFIRLLSGLAAPAPMPSARTPGSRLTRASRVIQCLPGASIPDSRAFPISPPSRYAGEAALGQLSRATVPGSLASRIIASVLQASGCDASPRHGAGGPLADAEDALELPGYPAR